MLALKEGKTEGRRDSTGGRGLMRGRGGLEEGERADMWARSVSDQRERGGGAGRAGGIWAGKGRWAAGREQAGGLKEGLGRERVEFVFFNFCFKPFQTFKL
jgi:hypothetical protein